MTLVVAFAGKTPLSSTGAPAGYQLWSYTIKPTAPQDLNVGSRIAFGLPSDLDIRDPQDFPDVPALAGTFVDRDPAASRLYVGRQIGAPGTQTISFVAPAAEASVEFFLVTRPAGGRPWNVTPFAVNPAGTGADNVQLLRAPLRRVLPVPSGRPVADFIGTLPYASEVFGVYQPLAGWLGQQSAQRFNAPALVINPDIPPAAAPAAQNGVLSPVGLVNLFREYFFEFDTFLGTPVGHVWISPGATVEVVETSTRRTLVERSVEQSETTDRKVEESLTDQDDIADAVKEDNANDTKLGASVAAGASFAGIYHGDASATFAADSSVQRSSETTHKHSRTQSAKVSSEIQRNFKTTFKSTTEATDTTSRRYLLQNTTDKLLNYELRRKVRKVGVQMQHIGSRLSWQVFLDTPGRDLGVGELVHVVPAPDLSTLQKPEQPPILQAKETQFSGAFPFRIWPGSNHSPHMDYDYEIASTIGGPADEMNNTEDNTDHIYSIAEFGAVPPAPGYTLSNVHLGSAKTATGDAKFFANYEIIDANTGKFRARATFLNFGGNPSITLNLTLTWQPPAVDPAQLQYQRDLEAYDARVAQLQREAFGNAVRDRLELVGAMRPRPAEDLRDEERQSVYGDLLAKLDLFPDNPHLGAELIRQIFDVDEMLYFVAPDYWRPHPAEVHATEHSVGRYPLPQPGGAPGPSEPLPGQTVGSWYSHTGADNTLDAKLNATAEWRLNYLTTERTQPAPKGSSLGWLVQIDGDERRNEFLNAAWVKAVLPIRPGHEVEALDWLAQAGVEGEAGLTQPYPVQPGDPAEYQNKTVGQVLKLLAAQLQAQNTDISNVLATEQVFETGFDPLAGGFRPAEPYQVFDQWVEVLPTDQVVAVAVEYDPKTGAQL
jgi:hypothetical protein